MTLNLLKLKCKNVFFHTLSFICSKSPFAQFLDSSCPRAVLVRVYSKVEETRKSYPVCSPVNSTPGTAETPGTTAPSTIVPHKRTLVAVTEGIKATLWTAVATVCTAITNLSPTAPYTPDPFPPPTVPQSPIQTSAIWGRSCTLIIPLTLCSRTAAHLRTL